MIHRYMKYINIMSQYNMYMYTYMNIHIYLSNYQTALLHMYDVYTIQLVQDNQIRYIATLNTYICMHIYIYMCIYVCIYIHIDMCISIYTGMCIYTYICILRYICIYIYAHLNPLTFLLTMRNLLVNIPYNKQDPHSDLIRIPPTYHLYIYVFLKDINQTKSIYHLYIYICISERHKSNIYTKYIFIGI
jgi:hypothetical protein